MAACWRAVGDRLAPCPRLIDDSTTGAQEATVYHHSIALALAEARVADPQNAAAHSQSTASPRRRCRRLRAAVLGPAAIAALAPAERSADTTASALLLSSAER